MPGRSYRIGRIAGIPVGVNPWWLVIVALITWELGASYYPGAIPRVAPVAAYGLGLLSVLLLFASILAHEFGHAIVARRRGVEVEEIDLWLLGGVSRMSGRPHTPEDEFSYALAGPAVTAAVALVFGLMAYLVAGTTHSTLKAVIDYEFEMNMLLLAFNLVPAFPLDGGRAVRALLWRHRGNLVAATETAAAVGRGFGYLLIGLGVLLTFQGWVTGLWLAVIGMFLVGAAGAERYQEEVVAAFTGVPVTDLMSTPVISIPSTSSAADVQPYFARHRYTAFPVVDPDGRATALLTIEHLERTRPSERFRISVPEIADHDPNLLIGTDADVADLLAQPAFNRTGHLVVIDASGRPIGIISRTDVQRAIRARRLGPTDRRMAS
jgi:Zn-dependent protease/predicted transcriptional regulator